MRWVFGKARRNTVGVRAKRALPFSTKLYGLAESYLEKCLYFRFFFF